MFFDGSTPTADWKATTPIFGELPDAGTSISKSSKKVTLLLGVAGDELLPPYVIFPSSAEVGKRKLDAKMFPAFKQVWRKHGHGRSYAHGNIFSATPSGGTTNGMFACWILEHLTTLYPDAADVPGKQVIMKADSGTRKTLLTSFLVRF